MLNHYLNNIGSGAAPCLNVIILFVKSDLFVSFNLSCDLEY